MLRISWSASGRAAGTAKVEGDIAGEHVSELARVVAQARGRHRRVVLDLVDVTFVDQAGAALLRTLRSQGIDLVGGSTFISGLVSAPPGGTGAGGVE